MLIFGKGNQTKLALSGLMLSTLILASCQSDAPRPSPARQAPAAVVVGPQPVSSTPTAQVRNTNSFPTFAGQLTAAGPQMSNEEARELEASMTSLGNARPGGVVSQAEYNSRVQELRKIASEQKPAGN